MAEPGITAAAWTDRMEHLKDAAQQRLLATPLPHEVMDQLIADGKAHPLGPFPDSPVRSLSRWWRPDERLGWVALDTAATTQLDHHAERYRAALQATSPENAAGATTENAGQPAPSPAATPDGGSA